MLYFTKDFGNHGRGILETPDPARPADWRVASHGRVRGEGTPPLLKHPGEGRHTHSDLAHGGTGFTGRGSSRPGVVRSSPVRVHARIARGACSHHRLLRKQDQN